MKQITIIKRLPRGVRFVQLPSDFKVDISIANDVVFVEFLDWKTSESLFFSFFFIDDDWHKSFDDFSEKGQELLLERLKDAIVNDISIFVSGKYEGVSELSLMMRTSLTNTQTLRKKQTNNNDLVRTHSIYSNPLGYVHLRQGFRNRW